MKIHKFILTFSRRSAWTAKMAFSRSELHVDDEWSMRSRALSGIFTSGRRPQGFSSTLLKVPNKTFRLQEQYRRFTAKVERPQSFSGATPRIWPYPQQIRSSTRPSVRSTWAALDMWKTQKRHGGNTGDLVKPASTHCIVQVQRKSLEREMLYTRVC